MRSDAGGAAGTLHDREPGAETVQLLVSDDGNRRAIAKMLEDRFVVETGEEVVDADLYLIEDRLLSEYRAALRARVEAEDPRFCPVVLIRRDTQSDVDSVDDGSDGPLLVDDFVDAPVDRTILRRRLTSLLVRREQSAELLQQVERLEESERNLRRFERAVEDTGNAIALLDVDGNIRYVNAAFEPTTGYDGADAVGESLELLGAEEPGFDDAFWRTVRQRGFWNGELVAERPNERDYVVDTTISTITTDGGDVEGFVAVLRDITGRIQRERVLQEREEELDLLREVLTRYLRHNLRNDLNVVLGHAELIAESATDEVAANAETIVRKTNRLLETADDARRYSDLIERDGDRLEYDLSAVATDAVADVRAAYPAASIEVDVPESCPVVASDGIRDVVAGLVENAVEHNDSPEPWARVRVRTGHRPRLVIEDNGPGIPQHDLEAFEAGHESPLSHTTGVGVWLSKWVIEGSGGSLSFDTGPDGTRTTVELPRPGDGGAEGIDVTDLKARERRLQTITDRMTDAVIEVDRAWQITLLDSRAADILGIDSEAAVDRELWTVLEGARGTEFETAFREAMASRTAEEVEGYYPPIDAWLAVYVYPDFDGGLSFYFRNVTDRKAREQELQHRQDVLRRIYEIIAERDRSFGEQVESLLALGREELDTAFGSLSRIDGDEYTFEIVDAADEDAVQPGDTVPVSATNCEVAAAQQRTLVLGNIERDAPELTDRAGFAEWGISCYLGAPVFVDGTVYGTFCFYDTEPRADQFSEWEVTLVDLLSRWVSYGLQIERDTRGIERENERLDRFVAVVSHDLRNPLSVLEGSIELAAETGDPEHFARAERAVDRMNALVDDLLKLARSGGTEPALEVVGLARSVDRAWDRLPAEGTELTVASDSRIRADPTMLRQLLENLLRNAVVYGGESVSVTDIEGGFAVEDDGPGIPPADRGRVFDVGYSTSSEGSGFGLAIVRDVVDAHGWTIALTAGADGGARFEITGVDVVDT
jgi:PAS domain S-box-containing protein